MACLNASNFFTLANHNALQQRQNLIRSNSYASVTALASGGVSIDNNIRGYARPSLGFCRREPSPLCWLDRWGPRPFPAAAASLSGPSQEEEQGAFGSDDSPSSSSSVDSSEAVVRTGYYIKQQTYAGLAQKKKEPINKEDKKNPILRKKCHLRGFIDKLFDIFVLYPITKWGEMASSNGDKLVFASLDVAIRSACSLHHALKFPRILIISDCNSSKQWSFNALTHIQKKEGMYSCDMSELLQSS